MILEVIVDLVFANHTTIAYEVHEAKGISSFGADREGISWAVFMVDCAFVLSRASPNNPNPKSMRSDCVTCGNASKVASALRLTDVRACTSAYLPPLSFSLFLEMVRFYGDEVAFVCLISIYHGSQRRVGHCDGRQRLRRYRQLLAPRCGCNDRSYEF